MRVGRFILPFVLFAALSACVSSLMIGNALQSRLMWALLQPLVGFDPNKVNLFEIPLVNQRMTALLGDYYAPTVTLLRTAERIQQEGPLIYLASRVLEEVVALPLPPELEAVQEQVEEIQAVQQQVEEVRAQVEGVSDQVKAVRSAAGMVWNADTNQLAVLLVEEGVSRVFSEQPVGTAPLLPVWPTQLQPLVDLQGLVPAVETTLPQPSEPEPEPEIQPETQPETQPESEPLQEQVYPAPADQLQPLPEALPDNLESVLKSEPAAVPDSLQPLQPLP
jgi:hypothetical protein